jgi:hypothetical protein
VLQARGAARSPRSPVDAVAFEQRTLLFNLWTIATRRSTLNGQCLDEALVMVRFNQCLALAVVLLAGGAASAADAQDASASAPATTPPAARQPASNSVTPDLVVDVNQLAARAPEPIVCREVLKQGSNVHVIYCLTRADWRRYRRAEAADAEDFVRALQGGTYSTIYR